MLGTDLEYGACDATWQRRCSQQGAHYRRIEVPLPFKREELVPRLMAAVTPRTRMISASHITSTTALILPVAELCAAARSRGIVTLIDDAHAPGQLALDIDAIGADFYAGNCHKWLCAPKGSGFLHARPKQQARLDARVTSWGYAEGTRSHTGFDANLGRSLFERRQQWQGTRDLSAWLAVPAAIDFQARYGWPEMRQRCHALSRQALETLTKRHGLEPIAREDDWCQMVAIPVPGQDAEALRHRLSAEHAIEVPVTSHRGQLYVRVSVQAYNDAGDIERLLAAKALAWHRLRCGSALAAGIEWRGGEPGVRAPGVGPGHMGATIPARRDRLEGATMRLPHLPRIRLPARVACLAPLLALAVHSTSEASPSSCPFKPELLTSLLGARFAAGVEEPGIGGTSCKYKTQGGSIQAGTDYSLWVLVVRPGPNQDIIRTMTAGGPKARFEPIAGDPDRAARVRGAANDSLIDVVYSRSGHVVYLRALGLGHEPDTKARAARDDAMATKLLKLPRLP